MQEKKYVAGSTQILAYSSALKLEVKCYSEISVDFRWIELLIVTAVETSNAT
jgi:hypothetical protein